MTPGVVFAYGRCESILVDPRKYGQTSTASTSGIANANRLTNIVYSYRWLANDAEIEGATSSTYPLQAAVNGKVITVRVAFTDDGLYLGVSKPMTTSENIPG